MIAPANSGRIMFAVIRFFRHQTPGIRFFALEPSSSAALGPNLVSFR
jgi:hypothetical protein